MNPTPEEVEALAEEWIGTQGGPTSAKVAMDHERRPGGCKCGTMLGDSIDWHWHLVNAAVNEAGLRLRAALAAPPLPETGGEGCHCGEPVAYGFDGDPTHHRGMCADCDAVRCDAYPGACRSAPAVPVAEDVENAEPWFPCCVHCGPKRHLSHGKPCDKCDDVDELTAALNHSLDFRPNSLLAEAVATALREVAPDWLADRDRKRDAALVERVEAVLNGAPLVPQAMVRAALAEPADRATEVGSE